MIVRLKDEIQPEDGGAIVDVGDCWNVFNVGTPKFVVGGGGYGDVLSC